MRQVYLAKESVGQYEWKEKKHGLIKYVQNFGYN